MSPYMDTHEPEELAEVIATLPPKHQDAIRAGWHDIARRSIENQRLLRKTLRTVVIWLFAISLVLAGVGYWSIKLSQDESRAQYEARLDRCVATNQAHDRSIAYVDSLFKRVSKTVPRSEKAQLEQSRQYDDRLFDVAFPRVKSCSRLASGETHLHTTPTSH